MGAVKPAGRQLAGQSSIRAGAASGVSYLGGRPGVLSFWRGEERLVFFFLGGGRDG